MNPRDPQTINAQVEAIWTAHRGAARRFILRRALVPDLDLVDDAVADAALQLQRWLMRGEPMPTYPRAWTIRVAWNHYLRATDRRRRVTLDNDLVDSVLADTDEASEIVDALTAEELAVALADALGRLTERQRTVILDYAQGRSYKEIAQRHNLSATGVNKAILRAKRNLANDGGLSRAVKRSRG